VIQKSWRKDQPLMVAWNSTIPTHLPPRCELIMRLPHARTRAQTYHVNLHAWNASTIGMVYVNLYITARGVAYITCSAPITLI
jgi:hypothetical protein